MWRLSGILAVLLGLSCGQAAALEVAVGRVVAVEPTFMPGFIKFYMDVGTPSCPANSWYTWQKSDENNKAVYATLLAAIATKQKIRLHFNDGDTSCVGQFIHLLDS